MKILKTTFSSLSIFCLALTTILIISSCENEDINDNSSAVNSKLNIHETILTMRNGAPAPGMTSVGEIAINSGFDELVNALVYVDTELNVGLVNLFVNGSDQYTVFAPTDEAFENLYDALNIQSIEDLPANLVLDVLLYHVTEGRRASNSVVPPNKMRKIETLLGENFYVYPNASIHAIGNTANITVADISASNGIIHVIDTVILPID